MFASGAVAWLIMGGMAVEAVVLVVVFRRSGRGLPPALLLPNLAAGACLVGALGGALRGVWWGWIGAMLLAGGVLHVVDLRRRWRSPSSGPFRS